ncbi:pollen receptor-like kinase 3 [Gossypium hirsutum]|uniref:Pollen receptor-like kinase 3 n=1 Tax=Gossypium hirsutum TaxID=3635 RepID=A0ABM3AFN7_GOSHI|nr:pollen receptor-like kinase 3 [Gossypium hirsutum]
MATTVPVFALFLSLLILPTLPTLCSSQSDAYSLSKFKKSLKNGDSKLKNWVPGSSSCRKKWIGVMCDGETIIGLHLTSLGLSGSVDVESLLKLRSLRTISLVKNMFEGSIPELNKLGALRAIYLSNNQFTGEIPNDYFESMGSLKKVWLNQNKFSGKIPDSLMQLQNLVELHLEGNRFSGKIPSLKYPNVMKSLDLKGNKLDGKIPESFSKFNASVFEGNNELCGKPLEKHSRRTRFTTTIIITIKCHGGYLRRDTGGAIISTNREDELTNHHSSSREPLRQGNNLPESTRQKPLESSRKSCPEGKIKRGSSQKGNKNGMADLVVVNEEKGSFGLQDLMKAAAEVLGSGGLGSAYKAVMGNGVAVVVKRMREMNRLGKDGFETEMQRFGALKHPNVLTPLAYHFRREEKLIVSQYMPSGSLLYALHGDRGVFHAKLNWSNRLKIIKGIAQGLGYIHTQLKIYEVPHGNLKASNVLLTETYEPKLSDYGFYSLIDSDKVTQVLFAYKSPEYLQSQKISPKSDIYCLGIILLEIVTGKFPSQYLNTGNGGIDIVQWAQSSISEDRVEELVDPEILSASSDSINQVVSIIRIGVACVESNPDQRLTMNEVICKILEVN